MPDNARKPLFQFDSWTPWVWSGEFSLSQLWVYTPASTGGTPPSNLETVEAGWHHFAGLYGDDLTHLFTYWTRDNYQLTGCYDGWCNDFTQTDYTWCLGCSLSPQSTAGGAQYGGQIALINFNGNWWLIVQNTYVGYYSRFHFNNLQNGAAAVDWGGEILNTEPNGHHTATNMGSGYQPSAGFGYAAFDRQLLYWDRSRRLHDPSTVQVAEDRYCYTLSEGDTSDPNWGHYFFFGGNGYNTNCQ